MSGVTHEYMEEYLRNLIPDKKGTLKKLEDFAKENSVPIIQKEAGKFLEFMINMKKPKRVLELGTAIGYSSILMAESVDYKLPIVTIERDDNMVTLAKSNIKLYGYDDRIDIIQGDCLEVLEKLDDKFDVIFMDPPYYKDMFQDALERIDKSNILKEDGIIVVEHDTKQEFPENVGNLVKNRNKKYGNTTLTFYSMED